MKKLSIITLMALTTLTVAVAQVKAPVQSNKSNIELLSEQTGTFVKREFIPVGKAKGVTVEILKITNLITDKVVSGVKLSGVYSSSYSSDTKSGFLDADEVDAFVNTLKYVKEKVFTSEIPAYSTEFNFNARGGVSGGAFLSGGKTWSGYVKLEQFDSNSYFFLKPEDFNALAELIVAAKSKL